MPWLYYEADTADKILQEIDVRETYTFPNSRLNLILIKYALNGSYIGKQSVTGGSLQLCASSEALLDAALQFGTTYKKTVSSRYRLFTHSSGARLGLPILLHLFLSLGVVIASL